MINFIGKHAKVIAARHYFLQGYIDKNLRMHARMHRELDNARAYLTLQQLEIAANIEQPSRFQERIAARRLSISSPTPRHFRRE